MRATCCREATRSIELRPFMCFGVYHRRSYERTNHVVQFGGIIGILVRGMVIITSRAIKPSLLPHWGVVVLRFPSIFDVSLLLSIVFGFTRSEVC